MNWSLLLFDFFQEDSNTPIRGQVDNNYAANGFGVVGHYKTIYGKHCGRKCASEVKDARSDKVANTPKSNLYPHSRLLSMNLFLISSWLRRGPRASGSIIGKKLGNN
jgi:hypothetical protein